MLSEQQQRIMGYFIEEAKDHLNTIEQGLLNLQSTISDPEMAHEVFRAAHSVKGGAAMLGLDSIQHTSHRLEDYFKVLKECPVQVDQRLESLLLNVFDTLRDLLDQLQGPFGLTDDKAQEAMASIEPTFMQLNEHISHLVAEAGATPPDDVNLQAVPQLPQPVVAAVAAVPEPAEESAFHLIFQSDVPARLRDMLQLFKQVDRPEVRQQLDEICQSLVQAGEQFELVPWVDLLNLTRRAIAHPDNDFRALAPVVIREIKHAQEQTLAGQPMAISAGDALLALVPPEPEPEFGDLESLDFLADDMEEVGSFELPELGFGVDDEALLDESLVDGLAGQDADIDFDLSRFASLEEGTLVQDNAFADLGLGGEFDPDALASMVLEDGPVVGAAELNSLADLFEANAPELSMTWQEEEILSDVEAGMPEPLEMDLTGDFSDLLQAELGSSPDLSVEDSLSEVEDAGEFPVPGLGSGGGTEDLDFLATMGTTSGEGSTQDILGDRADSDDSLMMGELNLFFSHIQDDSLVGSGALDLSFSEEEEESVEFLFEDTSESIIITDLPGMDDPFGGISISSFAMDEDEELPADAPSETAADGFSQDLEGGDVTLSSDVSGDTPFDLAEFELDAMAASTMEVSDNPFIADEMADLSLENETTEAESAEGATEAPISWLDMLDADEPMENMPVAPPLWTLDDEDVTADLWEDPAGSATPSVTDSLLSDFSGVEVPDEPPVVTEAEAAIAPESLLETDDLTFDLELPMDLTDDHLESLDLDLDSLVAASTAEVSGAAGGDEDLGLELTFDDLDEGMLGFGLEDAPANQDAIQQSDEQLFDGAMSQAMAELELDQGSALEHESEASLEDTSDDFDSLLNAADFDLETGAEELTGEDSASADWHGLMDASDLDFDLEGDTAIAPSDQADLGLVFEEPSISIEESSGEGFEDLLNASDLDLSLDAFDAVESSDDGGLGDFDSLLDSTDTENALDFGSASAEDSPLNLEFESFGEDDLDAVTDAAFAELSFDDDDLGADISPTLFPDDEEISEADATDLSLDLDTDAFLSEVSFGQEESEPTGLEMSGLDDFGDLDALLDEAAIAPSDAVIADSPMQPDDFADLESLLGDTSEARTQASVAEADDFADLDALLDGDTALPEPVDADEQPISSLPDDEFEDLEKLLEAADNTLGGPPSMRGVRSPAIANRRPAAARTSGMRGDQTMRVSVKNLDNLNNLIGELVVNRNSLEQAEERLRQFLDNLQYQVQQLSDVGQRMRDLYERSLLESSLMSSRKSYQMAGIPMTNAAPGQSHATGVSFDALEMDRFTGFHTLSQEMIELIVRVRESASDIDFVVGETDQVTRNFRQITSQLQESLTRARMVPFAQTADRLPRAVRDISLRCGKQAELTIEGRETLIDKMILEQLYDPMTHLVNNAITHGIETPDERTAQGKAPTGRITVRAFHQGNQTVIAVSDDGAGIDPDRVKQKAVERKLVTPEQARMMNRLDVYDLLFHHGFSTRDRADDFAGRGVGMDVVRTSLNDIRGVINIDSTVGRGTTFTIRLPLTLSVSKALCCISNRARIAFPMDGVEDMLDVPREQIQTNGEGQACIQWRDQLLPFQALADLLKFNRSLGRGSVYGGNQEEDIISVVVLRSNAGSYLALQVDQVLGEQEIVIKQLEGPVPKPVGIAGATVLGDGRIMPIADVLELIDLSQGRIRREPGTSFWDAGADQVPVEPISEVKTEPTVLIVDDSITVRELLSMTFNKVGYRVEQARDGQEAWEKLRSGLPCELVFCDIEMPRMDGLELLSRLQKDPHLGRIPIAMLTSRGADRHRQMAIQLGAKGYFTKPYLEEVLLDAAQRMLKGEILVEGATDGNG